PEPGLRGPEGQGRSTDAARHREGWPEAPRGREAAPGHRAADGGRKRQGTGDLEDGQRQRRHQRSGASVVVVRTSRQELIEASGRSAGPALQKRPASLDPWWSGDERQRHFGGSRIAPSRRITSPLSISFVTIWWTSLA